MGSRSSHIFPLKQMLECSEPVAGLVSIELSFLKFVRVDGFDRLMNSVETVDRLFELLSFAVNNAVNMRQFACHASSHAVRA